jgi:hypothetical protein
MKFVEITSLMIDYLMRVQMSKINVNDNEIFV